VLLAATRASAVFPTSLKDVEKAHVRDDSLFAAEVAQKAVSAILGAMPSSFNEAKPTSQLYWDLPNHDACSHLSLE
jgi:hypothetical protein